MIARGTTALRPSTILPTMTGMCQEETSEDRSFKLGSICTAVYSREALNVRPSGSTRRRRAPPAHGDVLPSKLDRHIAIFKFPVLRRGRSGAISLCFCFDKTTKRNMPCYAACWLFLVIRLTWQDACGRKPVHR